MEGNWRVRDSKKGRERMGRARARKKKLNKPGKGGKIASRMLDGRPVGVEGNITC
jgi:hypothetical protein